MSHDGGEQQQSEDNLGAEKNVIFLRVGLGFVILGER